MKSEPDVRSMTYAAKEPRCGMESATIRLELRSMTAGDQAFFYHSNCKPPGIVGLMKVIEQDL